MLTPNIQPLEDSVLPVCSYHLIGSCLRNSAHHQPPGRNTKPTKYQIEDGGIRPNPVSLYMANIRLTSGGDRCFGKDIKSATLGAELEITSYNESNKL
ncbi:hypothetical protein TNCV_3729221 [Trichonephila clavipes]|nr:hypothetical protein TNCV_3729221 [Trichonephila clavipes]